MEHFRRVAIVLALLATGCATPQARMCRDQPGGWCGATVQAVGVGWQYAQMANNAYGDDDFTLPGNIVTRFSSPNDGSGFAYAVFDRFEDAKLTEVIVAFRGTELSQPNDWLFGNLTGRHHRRGLAVVRELRRQLDQAGLLDVPITVTGHSLGGGISRYVAQRPIGNMRTVQRSVSFNNWWSYRRPIPDGDLLPDGAVVEYLAYSEQGELLSLFSGSASEAAPGFTALDCQPGFHPITDHKIRRLAVCMTWIAAFADPDMALLSLSDNPDIARPPAQTDGAEPAGLPQGERARPVNVFAPGGDYADPLFNALLAALGASPRFQPRFGTYAGLQLRIERLNPAAMRYQVKWQRNWVEFEKVDLDCAGNGGMAECARKLIELADQHFPEKPR